MGGHGQNDTTNPLDAQGHMLTGGVQAAAGNAQFISGSFKESGGERDDKDVHNTRNPVCFWLTKRSPDLAFLDYSGGLICEKNWYEISTIFGGFGLF